jgi:hypothetical protein
MSWTDTGNRKKRFFGFGFGFIISFKTETENTKKNEIRNRNQNRNTVNFFGFSKFFNYAIFIYFYKDLMLK